MLAAMDDLTFQRGSRELLTTTSKWSLTGNKIYLASRTQNARAPSPAPLVTASYRGAFGAFPAVRLLCKAARSSLESSGLSVEG